MYIFIYNMKSNLEEAMWLWKGLQEFNVFSNPMRGGTYYYRSMDCVVYRVAESQTRLSDFHSLENGALSKCSGPDLDQLKLNL